MPEFKKIIESGQRHVTQMVVEDGNTYIQTLANADPAIERATRIRNEGLKHHALGYHEASIDINQLQAWAQKIHPAFGWQDVANDDALLDRFLAEHSKFRIHQNSGGKYGNK